MYVCMYVCIYKYIYIYIHIRGRWRGEGEMRASAGAIFVSRPRQTRIPQRRSQAHLARIIVTIREQASPELRLNPPTQRDAGRARTDGRVMARRASAHGCVFGARVWTASYTQLPSRELGGSGCRPWHCWTLVLSTESKSGEFGRSSWTSSCDPDHYHRSRVQHFPGLMGVSSGGTA